LEVEGFDVGIASRPIAGEAIPGDATAVMPDGAGLTVALADGLGHGPDARASAERALEAVRRADHRPLESILYEAHARLTDRHLRGAVMGVARFDGTARTVAFAGVGNIDLVLIGATVTRLIGHYGILGAVLPAVRVYEAPFGPGDIALLVSDGVAGGLQPARYQGVRSLTATALAEIILRDAGKPTDDATAMVVRG
jgi:hypothetical protein